MTNNFFILYLLFAFSFTIHAQTDLIKEKDLLGCWVDSREENINYSDIRVFRPCGYKSFPPTRFRYYFSLKENNECRYKVVGSRDIHYMEEGLWSYDPKTKQLTIANLDGKPLRIYYVVRLENNLLGLKN